MLARSITSSSTSLSAACFPLAFLLFFVPPLLLEFPFFPSLMLPSSSVSSPNKKPLPFTRLFSSDEKVEWAVPEAKLEDAESSPSIQEKLEDVRCGRDGGERVEASLDGGDNVRAGGEVGRETTGEGFLEAVVDGVFDGDVVLKEMGGTTVACFGDTGD